MVIKFNNKTLIYKLILFIILFVEMHYFGLFTLPNSLEFIVYSNKAKWIGPLSLIIAIDCLIRHKNVLSKYTVFLEKYLCIVFLSLVFISIFTIVKYPLNPLITTYGFACYYLYSFLAIPIIYIFIVDHGYEKLFRMFNFIAVVMYLVTIIQGLAYIKTGHLLFAYSSLEVSVRNDKVRLSSGALGFLMIIYNFYMLYNHKKFKSGRIGCFVSIILGLLSIYFTGNSRIMVFTLLVSIVILILLGDGTAKKKIFAILTSFIGIFIIFFSGIIPQFLESFSSVGEYGGSSIARVGAYKYYWNCFLNNPIFANGFVGDEYYYDIVHGASGIYYQTVYVRFYYDDVGIAGQLALLGSFIIGIYIWPVLRLFSISYKTTRKRSFSDGKLLLAFALYVLCTTPTLIILDSGRVIAFPIILALAEFILIKFSNNKCKKLRQIAESKMKTV